MTEQATINLLFGMLVFVVIIVMILVGISNSKSVESEFIDIQGMPCVIIYKDGDMGVSCDWTKHEE